MSQKTKKTEKRAEVSFTFLVQTFIKCLLYTELQRETGVDEKEGERKTEEGAGGLGGALVIFSLVVKEALRRVGGCRTQSELGSYWPDPVGALQLTSSASPPLK